MRRFIPLLLLLLARCAPGNSQACSTVVGAATAVQDGQNNHSCPVGQVLVGYNPAAIGGPLLCATLLTTCPVAASP